ncbi:MAG: glycosyltransferase family 9 protein, partial [Candidatus Syntrophosphaera sp.]
MRILILRLSSLGDIILTQPIAAELMDIYPDAQIAYLCKPEYSALPGMFGLGLKTLEYKNDLAWHLSLRKQKYDIVLDLHAKFSTWLLMRFLKAGRKVVYDKKHNLRRAIVRGRTNQSIKSTLRLYYSALQKLFPDKFTPRTTTRNPKLRLNGVSDVGEATPRKEPGKNLVGLFIGAAHPTKAYPINQWIEFIHLTRDKYEFRLYGDEKDAVAANAIAKEFEGIQNLCGELSLAELAGQISQCDAVISGDTGPMHLAAALKKTQIAIFGATHPKLGFAPQNERAVVLTAGLDCQPCTLHGSERCPKGHFNCMKLITPQ